MRAIYGKPDYPDSAYILVLRGIDDESLTYLQSHSEKYPSWGCIIFPERGQLLTKLDKDENPIWRRFNEAKGIHSIRLWGGYVEDAEIIKFATKVYPPYNEDGDSETSSTDKTDSCKRIADIINESELSVPLPVSSILKDIKEYHTEEAFHSRMSATPLLEAPTRASFSMKIPIRELENIQCHKGTYYDAFIRKRIREMKSRILDPLIDTDSLWDIDMASDAANPYEASVNVRVTFKGRLM